MIRDTFCVTDVHIIVAIYACIVDKTEILM